MPNRFAAGLLALALTLAALAACGSDDAAGDGGPQNLTVWLMKDTATDEFVADFETEFESSPTLTFEIPESGDYMFFVRKKQVASPRTARFSMTISIK